MPHLLDTDWFIDYLSRDPSAVRLIEPLIPDGIAISVITYIEAYEGAIRLGDGDIISRRLERWLVENVVLVLDVNVGRRAAEIRRALRLRGRRFDRRPMDVLIAATAIAHRQALVTRNVDDYSDIPGLTLYEAS